MALQIYNTLSKTKEPLRPLVDNQVRMYVCGMTVYDFCHIGHARVMVAFDVISRWLRHRGYDLTYVRNITDIDDKIIRRAAENGESFQQLTERMIAAMHEDEGRLGVLRPDQEPRASEHIDGMFRMIQTLIDKGYAYAPGNGDVYYRVSPAGLRPGVRVVPAGISNVRSCPPAVWATPSTSMVVVLIWYSRTTKTRLPRAKPLPASPTP